MTSDNFSRANRRVCGGRLIDTFNVVSQDSSAGTKELSVGCRQYSRCAEKDQKEVLQMELCRRFGHVARMGERRNVYGVLVGKPTENDHLEDPVID